MKQLLVCLTIVISTYSNAQEWKWYNNSLYPTLASNDVPSLAIGDSGKVYAGTLAGLSVYQNGTWKKLAVGNNDLRLRRVWAYPGSVWAGTEYNGLWGYKNNTWKNYDPNTAGNGIIGFGIDSRDSMYRLDKFGKFDLWNGNGWTNIMSFFSQPNNLFVDKSDNIWLLSNNTGLYKYKQGLITPWGGNYLPTDSTLSPSGSLFDMVQDSTGVYWIAADNGLLRFDGTYFRLYTTQNSGLPSNRTRCLSFDKTGSLWIGTWNAGMCKWDGTTWTTYDTKNSPLTSNIINDIVVDTANVIWVANGYNEFMSPSGGQGVFSLNQVNDVSNGQLPAAPASLQSKVISVNEVKLNWTDASNNETGFQLERSTGDSTHFQQIKFLTINTVNFTDMTVTGNTIYYYRIRSVNSRGSSSYSNTIMVQPKYCTVNKSDYNAYANTVKVIFGTIDNRPFNSRNGYYDYLDQKTQIFKGQTLMLTVAFDRYSITSDPVIGGSVYIDWNSDGDFDDSGELVLNKLNIDGRAEFRIPITVPDFVVPGTITRLRIRAEDDVYPNTVAISPCGYAEETQDYTLELINPPTVFKPTSLSTNNVLSRVQYVEWQDNSASETAYLVEHSTDSINFTRIAVLSPNTIQFKDAPLQPDTRYYYRIYAKTGNDSAASNIYGSTTLSADLMRQLQGDAVTQQGFPTGAYWDDYNNDGKCDLYVTGTNLLYKNESGVLNNSSLGFINGSTAAWADFDNDGDDDVYLGDYLYGGGSSATALFENKGDGTFMAFNPFTPDGRINNTVWTDYNNDGYLDLYVSYIDLGYGKLYRNNKNKTFSFVQQFTNTSGYASFVDYDSDGDDDLVVMGSGNTVIFNKQDSLFTRNTSSSFNQVYSFSRGVSWADFDNDGDLDVFVPAADNQQAKLYRNFGSAGFGPEFSFPAVNGSAYGSAWADYDNDGWQDIFVSRFNKTNKLLRNKQGTFQEVAPTVFTGEDYSSFPYDEMPSLGSAWGDVNNDGFLDLFVVVSNGFKNRLYVNGGNQYNWIAINLKGKVSNSNAIGAMVKVKANGQWQYRWVQSGSGYSAHNSFTVEFGFKNAVAIDSLVIRWPSGIVQTMNNVNTNQRITITETSVATAVNNIVESGIYLYPNPASQTIFVEIKTNEVIKDKTVKLYDVQGRLTQKQLKQIGANLYSIDVTGLTNSIYWIELKGRNRMIRKQVIVLR